MNINLAQIKQGRTGRCSPYDQSGRNHNVWTIKSGETKVLADIRGPGAHHPYLDDATPSLSGMSAQDHVGQCEKPKRAGAAGRFFLLGAWADDGHGAKTESYPLAGGYIGGTSHSIMPETPRANVIAMYEAFLEYQ